jgi:Flp pilus assembly protein TadG
MDAALQRIIAEAARRHLREQTTTINEEDVRAALSTAVNAYSRRLTATSDGVCA